MKHRFRKYALRSIALLLLFTLFTLPTLSSAQTVRTSVKPSATDPAIDTFDSDHTVYFNPTAKSRHQLLVFLPGTNGKTLGTKQFCTLAADLGYHVISLMYPDDIAASVCWNDDDQNAFTKFRMGIIEGGTQSPRIHVNRANSIENRLIKLLVYLKANHASEDWGQFLKGDEPYWERVALAGQSQGGGHAGLIAIKHKVARVLMFSSPKDWSRHFNKPASWYSLPSQTPASRLYVFVHEQDKQGCSYEQQLEIVKAFGLTKEVAPISIDTEKPPFAQAHVLTTNYPGTRVTSMVAHTTEVTDGGSPKDKEGSPLFKPVWTYLLTAE